ncbi:MAG: dihydroneopterin aldolase [Pseudomonadota bacterium]
MSTDRILIEALMVRTRIGVNDWEREIPQTLSLTLALTLSLDAAAESDDVSKTLDYGVACELIRAHLRDHSYLLIERLADCVGRLLLDQFPALEALTVEVRKFDVVPGTDAVGVVRHLSRRSEPRG